MTEVNKRSKRLREYFTSDEDATNSTTVATHNTTLETTNLPDTENAEALTTSEGGII